MVLSVAYHGVVFPHPERGTGRAASKHEVAQFQLFFCSFPRPKKKKKVKKRGQPLVTKQLRFNQVGGTLLDLSGPLATCVRVVCPCRGCGLLSAHVVGGLRAVGDLVQGCELGEGLAAADPESLGRHIGEGPVLGSSRLSQ